jgi:hypothetical protein
MNFLEFKILWTDSDGMVQLAVSASSLTHTAYHETYLYPTDLKAFAAELKEYPRDMDAEVVLECGAKAPNVRDYFRLRVFLLKRTGLSALEFESEVRGDPPLRAESHFFIPGWPADFNHMGSKLLAWLADTSAPVRIEWESGYSTSVS